MIKKNKTYFIETYGCQMNVADSELVESILLDEGFKKALDGTKFKRGFIR